MFLEKFFNDLPGALLFFIPFLAVVQQQGQENAGFFYTVKWEGCKQAVVQLKLDAYIILELLQPLARLVIHQFIIFMRNVSQFTSFMYLRRV